MAALRESREWLTAVFAASRDAVVLETSGRITQANDACARLFGHTKADELIGLPLSKLLPEHDAARMLKSGHSHAPGSAPELFIFNSIRRDSTPVQLEASVGAVALDGEPHSVIVLRDVSARANLEAQLRHAQKMEAVGQLANGVAHDFNNLLTAIRCQTETILAYEQITPTTKEMLQQVVEATERAANLTRQLLTFSRRTPMQPSTVNLNDLSTNVTKLLKRLITENIVLDLQLHDPLPPVCADASMIEQTIVNLAVNARDAMPRGGRLTLSTALNYVDANHVKRQPGAHEGEYVALRVTDTGGGIAPAVLPRIFEPFFTTKDVGKGTGLGLAVVTGIVQQHEGWIEVESTAGRGTTFTVFLPARRDLATTAAAIPKQDTGAMPVGNEPLLLVEDDPQLRKLIKATLEKFGYRVTDAGTGAETMRLWEKHSGKIRLALVDLILPEGVNGLELVEQMRIRQPGLRVILMSGYGEEIPDLEQKAVPGVKLLSKPFDPQSLARLVRSCLDEKTP
ncbi:MAG: response regulator [Verrucomicrobia bacterium]|nr:response regulator [Verrucomicrobiota bacterium]